MTTLRRYTFWIEEPMATALKALVNAPGEETKESFHVRLALREYLMRKGYLGKPARPRIAPHKTAKRIR